MSGKTRKDSLKFAAVFLVLMFLIVSISVNISQSYQIRSLTRENAELMKNYREISDQFNQMDSLFIGLIDDVIELTKHLEPNAN